MLSRADQDALRALVGLAQREYEQLVLAERLQAEAPVPLVTPRPGERSRPETASNPNVSPASRKPR